MTKTVLCYGDSNTWGAAPMTYFEDRPRFDQTQRWTGIVRDRLGPAWHVVEEGLPGRTTCHDDPVEGADRNGLSYLTPCLHSHRPIDVVVLMLGTNDLKTRFGVGAEQIATSVFTLSEVIAANGRLDGQPPALIIVCPPPILEVGCLRSMFAGGAVKSQQMATHYRRVAQQRGATFLDAGSVISSSALDGIHFDMESHRALGVALHTLIAAAA